MAGNTLSGVAEQHDRCLEVVSEGGAFNPGVSCTFMDQLNSVVRDSAKRTGFMLARETRKETNKTNFEPEISKSIVLVGISKYVQPAHF